MPANTGAWIRSGDLIKVTAPLPETKLSCVLEEPPPLQLVKVSVKKTKVIDLLSRFIFNSLVKDVEQAQSK